MDNYYLSFRCTFSDPSNSLPAIVISVTAERAFRRKEEGMIIKILNSLRRCKPYSITIFYTASETLGVSRTF
jgi:hypothetical protein